jgi:hypothetical protein
VMQYRLLHCANISAVPTLRIFMADLVPPVPACVHHAKFGPRLQLRNAPESATRIIAEYSCYVRERTYPGMLLR